MMYNSFFSQFFLKTIWRRYDSNWTCSRSFSICFSDSCSNHASLKRQNARNHKNMSCFTRSSQDILLSAEVKSNIPVSWEQGGWQSNKFSGYLRILAICPKDVFLQWITRVIIHKGRNVVTLGAGRRIKLSERRVNGSSTTGGEAEGGPCCRHVCRSWRATAVAGDNGWTDRELRVMVMHGWDLGVGRLPFKMNFKVRKTGVRKGMFFVIFIMVLIQVTSWSICFFFQCTKHIFSFKLTIYQHIFLNFN